MVGKTQLLNIKAGPTATPRNVKVTNLGSSSFTVSWTTDVPVVGYINYSDNPGKVDKPAGDSRDQSSKQTGTYTTHYVEVMGLNPNKVYYFVVGSGSETYDDNGRPYQIKTWSQASPPSEDTIYGKILMPTNNGAGGAIVYVDADGGNTVSTLSKDDGSWRLPLSMSRNKQGEFLKYDPQKTSLTIFVQGGNIGTATALTNTSNDAPVPDITLGKTHNFAEAMGAGGGSDSTSNQDRGEGFNGMSASAEENLSVKLNNPEFSGETLGTDRPEFSGTGPAGTVIRITINSNRTQTGQVTVDNNGVWKFTPAEKLEAGGHTITLEYNDELGIIQRIIRNFTVLAASNVGGLPAFTATPSATISPSATPTASISPSASPSATKTPTPSKASTNSGEATGSGLPEVGILTPTYTLLIVGVGLYIFGWILKKKQDQLHN